MAGNAQVVNDMRAVARLVREMGGRTAEAVGWTDRGRESYMDVKFMLAHHTAAPVDIPNLLRDGRADLPGPLCNWELRASGLVVLLASGRANHAGVGTVTNNEALGVEATGPIPLTNTGKDAFPQYVDYVRLAAAHVIHFDWPIGRILGHKETARPLGRKVNPAFNMDIFRDDVQRAVVAYHEGGGLLNLDTDAQNFIKEQTKWGVRWVDHGDNETPGSSNNLAEVRKDIVNIKTAITTLATSFGLTADDVRKLLDRPPLDNDQVALIGNLAAQAVTEVLAGTSLELSEDDKAELADAAAAATLEKLRQHPLVPTAEPWAPEPAS